MGEAQSCPGGTFRTNFGGGWELNHLRDLQNFKTSAKLGLSSSIRGMVDLCSSKDKVRDGEIRREVGSENPKIRRRRKIVSVRAGGVGMGREWLVQALLGSSYL